jgi:hypothetical protein
MSLKLLASGVAALAMLAFASGSEPAQARGHGGHGHGYIGAVGSAPRISSVRQFSSARRFSVHHHRHHRRFAFVDVYPYTYGDDCYWLKRRALYSGSAYWWRRYYACRHGYY